MILCHFRVTDYRQPMFYKTLYADNFYHKILTDSGFHYVSLKTGQKGFSDQNKSRSVGYFR